MVTFYRTISGDCWGLKSTKQLAALLDLDKNDPFSLSFELEIDEEAMPNGDHKPQAESIIDVGEVESKFLRKILDVSGKSRRFCAPLACSQSKSQRILKNLFSRFNVISKNSLLFRLISKVAKLPESPELNTSENAVIALIAAGHNLSEVADIRHVAAGTIKNQLKTIRIKLGCQSTSEAIAAIVSNMGLRRPDQDIFTKLPGLLELLQTHCCSFAGDGDGI
jgi:DNA-binding CsgD family transcriptional regulator